MKSWIKILSLFLLLGEARGECQFRSAVSKVYSLSGPITVALKEMGLLKSDKLKGVSVFHPVAKDEFKGKFLPGGIFLSRELALEMKGSVVFYDESRELGRMLKGMEVQEIEFKSRALSPLEVMSKVESVLRPHLEGCDKELASLQTTARKLSSEMLKLIPQKFKAVFFLGSIRGGRPPEMAMVNDGVVKWLKDEGKLVTYPSELAYVSWSVKVLNALPGDTLKIGLVDSGQKLVREIKRPLPRVVNLTYPGVLIPGLSQLAGWLYLLESLSEGQDA